MANENRILQFTARQEGNPADRTVRFVGTTSATDRDKSRLVMGGMRAEEYRKNPIVSWNHKEDSDDPEVAVIGRSLSEEVFTDRVEVVCQFEPDNPVADKVLRKVLAGFLKGMSVTFQPIREHMEGQVRVIDEWDLWSWSVVPIPSNAAALVKRSALSKNGRVQMNEMVMKKLGLTEGATFDEAIAALLTYLASTDDSKEDRQAVVDAVMAMKGEPDGDEKSADKDGDGDMDAKEMRTAVKNLADAVVKINERLAGMETRSAEAEKAAKTEFYRQRMGGGEKRSATPNFGTPPGEEGGDLRKSVAESMKAIEAAMADRTPRRAALGG